MRKQIIQVVIAPLILLMLVVGGSMVAAQDGQGILEFYANGEDFVRQGFISKDGWQITFDRLPISIADVVAYQAEQPYDTEEGGEVEAGTVIALADSFVVDLAEGDEDADLLFLASVEDAPEGHYNALSWNLVNAEQLDDYTLVIAGTAAKDDQVIDFTIKIETEYAYVCGEYVGDMRKGILDADDTAELEMTFHFDHVFGDGELEPDDDLNMLAPGFDMFAALAEDGQLDVDMAALETALSEDDYQMLVDILPTLGHVGEGHCHEMSLAEDEV